MRTEDDGSTLMGVWVSIAVIVALVAGYVIRDLGFKVIIQQQEAPTIRIGGN